MLHGGSVGAQLHVCRPVAVASTARLHAVLGSANDHHNVQITPHCSLAAAIWSDRVPWAAWAAGALSGIALAIGFEGLPFVVVAGGIFALRYLFNRENAPALSRYGQSLAVSTVLVFLVSIGSDHWTQRACDAMAINTAAPAILGALALNIAGSRLANERIFVRCAAVMKSIALTATIFVLLEPRCLGGPLALVDPAVRPIWLAHVHEVQSLIAMIRENPPTGYGIASYPVAALLAAIMLAHDKDLRRDSGYLAATMALLVAIAMTLIAIRAAPYTIWLGMPFVAAALSRLFDRLNLVSLPARVLMTVLFSPVAISFSSVTLTEAIGRARPMNKAESAKICLETENYTALAKLPTGVIVTDVDYGPFLLALTPHSVLGAPYHRLSYGIVASHRAFAAPPEEARETPARW